MLCIHKGKIAVLAVNAINRVKRKVMSLVKNERADDARCDI